MARLCRATFPFQGRRVISVWSRWHVASYHPLGANMKRRRCTLALDSENPLVHSTQTTKPTGSALDLDRRAGEADLICLLTDGSPYHTQPPTCQPCWSGSGPPTARLERARGRRWRWLLLNMKCRSLGMSTLFRPGEAQRIDSLIREINWARFHSACVAEWKVVLIRGSRTVDVLFDALIYTTVETTVNLEKLIFATTNILWTYTSGWIAPSLPSLFLKFVVPSKSRPALCIL